MSAPVPSGLAPGLALSPGATLGEGVVIGAIVGACSLVDADVPEGTTVAGTPARPLPAQQP